MGEILIALVLVFMWTSLDVSNDGTYTPKRYYNKENNPMAIVKVPKNFSYKDLETLKIRPFIKQYNDKLSGEELDLLIQTVNETSQLKNIDPSLIYALMARESGFDPKAVSKSGAMGLGQLKSFHYSALGISDPFQIDQNARGVVLFLADLIKKWEGYPDPVILSLASYKEGYGAVSRSGAQYKPDTQKYIQEILSLREKLLGYNPG